MAYAQSNDNSEVVLLHRLGIFKQEQNYGERQKCPVQYIRPLFTTNYFLLLFYGMNEQKIQWVENEDWEYRTSFTVTMEQLERDDARLIFEGLDTYADVYLNGSLLLKSDNMFVGYSLPVKSTTSSRGKTYSIYISIHLSGKLFLKYASNGFNYPKWIMTTMRNI